MFIKLLGQTGIGPQPCARGCPGVLELADGSFAVIGTDITAEAADRLPPGAGCAPGERVVRIPRELLVRIRSEIPHSA
jgi:hypothetical protein